MCNTRRQPDHVGDQHTHEFFTWTFDDPWPAAVDGSFNRETIRSNSKTKPSTLPTNCLLHRTTHTHGPAILSIFPCKLISVIAGWMPNRLTEEKKKKKVGKLNRNMVDLKLILLIFPLDYFFPSLLLHLDFLQNIKVWISNWPVKEKTHNESRRRDEAQRFFYE